MARSLQLELGEDYHILIDDAEVQAAEWKNSLMDYDLPRVSHIHEDQRKGLLSGKQRAYLLLYRIFGLTRPSYNQKYGFEKRWQKSFNRCGLYICENGYLPMDYARVNLLYVEGYFQSEKYFAQCREIIRQELRIPRQNFASTYPGFDEICTRNTVCISIKVEHNVGNSLYSVCDRTYWERAITYITEHVENPLFFICSDDVDYVIHNLIDTTKYDYLCQDSSASVSTSLTVMSYAKHFVIGNTTYGWWAQYLSDYEDKIVIAPSRWMNADMPIDIYDERWTLIEV